LSIKNLFSAINKCLTNWLVKEIALFLIALGGGKGDKEYGKFNF